MSRDERLERAVNVAVRGVCVVLCVVIPPIAFILTLFLWEHLTNIWWKIGWLGTIVWSFWGAGGSATDGVGYLQKPRQMEKMS